MRTALMTAGAAWVIAAGTPALAAPAKAPPPSAKEAAERFSLDLAPADEEAATTAADGPAPQATAGAARVPLTLDTPIADLLASRRGRAVLDRDMPGLSTDKNLDKFKSVSLRKLAPLSGGRLTPELLETVGKHLAAAE